MPSGHTFLTNNLPFYIGYNLTNLGSGNIMFG